MTDGKEKRQRIKLGRTGFLACHNRTEDTHVLSDKAKEAYDFLPSPTIRDIIMYYSGDKYVAVDELTNIKINISIKSRSFEIEHRNMLANINRYLSGKRRPSKKMLEIFREVFVPQSIKSLQIKIKGCVKVSNEYYYKENKWTNPIIIPASDVNDFLNLAIEDIFSGYAYLNGLYMQSGTYDNTFVWLDNVQIELSFI